MKHALIHLNVFLLVRLFVRLFGWGGLRNEFGGVFKVILILPGK